MPLPLPNLDTRRWADLVEEATALVPRYAPQWTDHNLHDPGITTIDLLAWMVEQSIYRTNRIPDRHRRKFLALAGYTQTPPLPAAVVLGLRATNPVVDGLHIPTGVRFRSAGSAGRVVFRTRQPITLSAAALTAVQVQDGSAFIDRTRWESEGLPFPAFGDDPTAVAHDDGPALYLGFNRPLTADQPLSLYFTLTDAIAGERERILRASEEQAEACAPQMPSAPFPAHHSARLVWEQRNADGWHEVAAVADDTRSLTLSGTVRVHARAGISEQRVGVLGATLFYLRARLVAGAFDVAPSITFIEANAVPAVQSVPGLDTLFESNAPGTIVTGTGLPQQQGYLVPAPVAHGAASLWTVEDGARREWELRADFDASTSTDAHFTLDATTGLVRFGDGRNGRVPRAGAAIVAQFDTTLADQGNIAAGQPWTLAAGPHNDALLGGASADLDRYVAIRNRAAATGGTAQETLSAAATRAAEALWAHERLVELCPEGAGTTLDQLDGDVVRERVAPARAATTLDFERIALDVPGTRVQRARAWSGIDPNYPCMSVPGTVTLVIVPALPAGAPAPSCGLIRAVRRYLHGRRVICTRLVVVGPHYLEVGVTATVAAVRGADTARVRTDVITALDTYLDPLKGGAEGRGWPFGRDVYRSELLAVIDGVNGVDHVVSLTLSGNGEAAACSNLCVAETWLVRSGAHDVQVVRS